MFDLSGKNVLITGASGGIGGEIARCLHSLGATVTLSGTRLKALEELARDLGTRVHLVVSDLSSLKGSQNLLDKTHDDMGDINILVNNAGITRDNLALRMKEDDWQSDLDINLSAYFFLCRGALRGMIKKRWGRIISITSISPDN